MRNIIQFLANLILLAFLLAAIHFIITLKKHLTGYTQYQRDIKAWSIETHNRITELEERLDDAERRR